MKIQLTEKAAEILLALTALIWGSGFVCYKNLMSLLTPIQFVVVRSFFSAVCAGLFFLCVIRRASRREWLGGFLLGGILAAAGLVQTYGIRITSSGNCAFLTGTNVVMVPFLSWALTKKKPGRSNLFSALMMFAGVCLLTVDFNNITAVNAGDLLSFLGAFLYAVHIAVTGKLSGTVRPKAVTCLQFLALFTVNLLFVPLEETPFIIPPERKDIKLIPKAITNVETTLMYLTDLFIFALTMRDRASNDRYGTLIRDAKDYIAQNYSNSDFSLNMIATHIGVSPSYFSSIFKQETGQSFVEYLTKSRIDKACGLLKCTTLRTAEIGERVGYNDPHYFSSTFKKITGQSPKEFKAKEVKNES